MSPTPTMLRLGLRTAAMAGALALLCPPAAAEDIAIRAYHVNVPEAALTDLRQRIAATRWPAREVVADQSQGVQLGTIRPLVQYWGTGYDWRKAEARLNALPQFVTRIDGVNIQFVVVKSRHPGALPLLITHGWPGSIFELTKVIGPLTDPTAHGGTAADAFDVILPSMPGYGFSGQPTAVGWGPDRMARAWAVLMQRLGYKRYVAQGATGVRSSPAPWHARPPPGCSPSTSTCRPPYRPRSRRP